MISVRRPLGSTPTVEILLQDFNRRKGSNHCVWFSQQDLNRLEIQSTLATIMLNLQHTFKKNRMSFIVDAKGKTDQFSIQEIL